MKRALIVHTPLAGRARNEKSARMVREKLDSLGYEIDWFVLNPDFEEKIKNHDFSKAKLIVALGGDGTVKVAGRIILQNHLKVPLAVIPIGSANVIARELKLPFKIEAAVKLLARPERAAFLDAGLINGQHYFFVGFSLGYVSEVVARTPAGFKKKLGFLGYFFSLLFNKIKLKVIRFKIQTLDRTFRLAGNSLVVFNAVNYHGLKPRRKIFLDDGVFSLFVFTSKTFWVLLSSFFFSLSQPEPLVKTFALDSDYFKITLPESLASTQVDGDYLDLPRVIEIKVLTRALKVVVK